MSMIFRYKYPGGVWVDLEQPTVDEIRHIAQEFSISERIEAELLSPTPSPLVAGDENAALLVLHFPVHETKNGVTKDQELDFVVGSHFIITVRYEVIVSLHHLKKLLEAQKIIDHHSDINTDVLLEILFAHLYTAIRDYTNHTADALSRVERDMFDGHERDTVRSISNISREFLHLESALASQEEPCGRFLKMLTERNFFGASFLERAQRIEAERLQVARLIKTHRAVAIEMRETNSALLSAKQNEIIKILTVVSFIFLPLALITKIFAMKLTYMPFVDDPNGFWIILGSMFFIAFILLFYVSRKRWID